MENTRKVCRAIQVSCTTSPCLTCWSENKRRKKSPSKAGVQPAMLFCGGECKLSCHRHVAVPIKEQCLDTIDIIWQIDKARMDVREPRCYMHTWSHSRPELLHAVFGDLGHQCDRRCARVAVCALGVTEILSNGNSVAPPAKPSLVWSRYPSEVMLHHAKMVIAVVVRSP